MKLTIRAFVVISTQNKVTVARTSMLPVPMCPPDDPNGCGIGQR
jgi:hypothetical protein